MTQWILAVVGLFVAQTLLPATLRYVLAGAGVGARLKVALGPRDAPPPHTTLSARAERALGNMQEALPVFLTVALLLVHQGDRSGSARNGAALFFAARALYVPAYLWAPSGVRSALWMTSWAGLGTMITALVV